MEGCICNNTNVTGSSVEYGTAMCESLYATAVETQIEDSKVHWSELSSYMMEEEDREQRAESNRRAFQSLQESSSGGLFHKWLGNDLVMEEKIAAGGQAEIYRATFTYSNGILDRGAVLKVFRLDGPSLSDLVDKLPQGLTESCGLDVGVHSCWIEGARLLNDGRFAFQMMRYWGDLWRLIKLRVQDNHNQGSPFSSSMAYRIMWQIAQGMHELRVKNIPHRDLKASNVLILPFPKDKGRDRNRHCPIHSNEFMCHVSDYEFSSGVVGTRFWRAPEILCALKHIRNNRDLFSEQALQDIYNDPELFSERADVYSFAMTCYEVLTGRTPFEDVPETDYESVCSGKSRLKWPLDIDPQLSTLLECCCDLEPSRRPTFSAIAEMLKQFQ